MTPEGNEKEPRLPDLGWSDMRGSFRVLGPVLSGRQELSHPPPRPSPRSSAPASQESLRGF